MMIIVLVLGSARLTQVENWANSALIANSNDRINPANVTPYVMNHVLRYLLSIVLLGRIPFLCLLLLRNLFFFNSLLFKFLFLLHRVSLLKSFIIYFLSLCVFVLTDNCITFENDVLCDP